MEFISNSRNQDQSNEKLCPKCGQAMGERSALQPPVQREHSQEQPLYEQHQPSRAVVHDFQSIRAMSILAYVFFLIPLFTGAHKTSPVVKYHTNQGAILFILAVAYSLLNTILRSVIRFEVRVWGIHTGAYYTPVWLSTILWIGSLFVFALYVLGVFNAINGKMKPLPIIGDFTVIK